MPRSRRRAPAGRGEASRWSPTRCATWRRRASTPPARPAGCWRRSAPRSSTVSDQMERGREAVAGVEELSANAAQALDAIVGTTSEAGRHAEAIAATASEQLGAVSGLSEQIERVAAGSARTRTETDAAGAARRGRGGRAGRAGAGHPPAGRRRRRSPAHRAALRRRDLRPVAARERAYVALGSNLGDRAEHLAAARAALAALPGHRAGGRVRAWRRPRRSAAWTSRRTSIRWCCWRPGSSPARCWPPARRSSAAGAGSAPSGGARARWTSTSSGTAIAGSPTPDLIIPHPELSNRDFWLRELAELEAHER